METSYITVVWVGFGIVVFLISLVLFYAYRKVNEIHNEYGAPKNQNPPPPPMTPFERMSIRLREEMYMEMMSDTKRMIERVYGKPPFFLCPKTLEQQLDEAVETENYELAAILRDQIKAAKP
jgi:hypothetical protein